MPELHEIRCVGCEGGVPPLSNTEIETYLKQVPAWQLSDDKKRISQRYEFKGFYKTMAFVNAVAWIANQEGHHPDMEVGYHYCVIHFTTHAINGLTTNDFICAAKIDKLNAHADVK